MFELVAERRAAEQAGEEGGDDVLAMLLEARHEDGSPMSDAGAPRRADDVASSPATRRPRRSSRGRSSGSPASRAVTARLTAELDAADGDDYLTATINEILRLRPVLPNAEPRLTKRPITIGGFEYPAGVALLASAYLVHHDPDIYPDPYAFRPERFLDRNPGTYTWIPFGGGRRRCLGASFALQEMKIVLRAALSRYELAPARDRPELTSRRSITFSPGRGATVILRDRIAAVADPPPPEKLAAVA